MKILFQWGCPDFTVAKILQQTQYGETYQEESPVNKVKKGPPKKKIKNKIKIEEDDEILTIILLNFWLDVKK